MGASTRRERILVVDDEPQLLTALDDTLGDLFDVVGTSEPARALELAADDQEIAVVISDMLMPGMTGDQLLSRLRAISDASRMVITGRADLTAVIRAVNDGNICAYVTKPWTTDDLRLKVRLAAEQFRLSRELRVSEERLRLAFEASSASLFDWNIAADELLCARFTPGVESAPQVNCAFATVEQRVHPDDLPALRAALDGHLQRREPFGAIDLRVQSQDGRGYRWYALNAQGAWDDAGKPRRLVGSIRDVDDLRQAQERLRMRAVLEAYGAVAESARRSGVAQSELQALDTLLESNQLDELLEQAPRVLRQLLERTFSARPPAG